MAIVQPTTAQFAHVDKHQHLMMLHYIAKDIIGTKIVANALCHAPAIQIQNIRSTSHQIITWVNYQFWTVMGLIFVESLGIMSVYQPPIINVRFSSIHFTKIGIIGMMMLKLVDVQFQLIKGLLEILREWIARVNCWSKARDNSRLWLYDASICHRLTNIVKITIL